ncbi:hypothetical protein ACF3DV_19360 [Chlorogloeopsis fritschii PCC 9212]|uniref:Uncharacterized protein n=1 Tax=Chlorogloeopsis fritschii PCC 6912 TaxID=211165 RepID=A0A3S1A320_CHLFR|nr:hypothetical protein [Chlorogloeopsis fritschii]RUR84467.1 hypothetical protein PCC6912_13620 [Chlorogloeopsis fritschii PCC 6912]
MQFQIECNSKNNSQKCLICHQHFQMNAARLIVYNDQGDSYGDICPQCIARGGNWIKIQLHAFSQRGV